MHKAGKRIKGHKKKIVFLGLKKLEGFSSAGNKFPEVTEFSEYLLHHQKH